MTWKKYALNYLELDNIYIITNACLPCTSMDQRIVQQV